MARRPRGSIASVAFAMLLGGSLVAGCGGISTPTLRLNVDAAGSPDGETTDPETADAETADPETAEPETAEPETPDVSPTPTPEGTPAPTVATAWKVVVNDQFDAGLPKHWRSYDGPYKSGAHNCALPSHSTVHDGYLDLKFSYEAAGRCGPGWYSGGLALTGASSIDARVTVRYRVVQSGDVSAHRIIPMRWPDDEASWPHAGEEDYCEGESVLACSAVLHYAGNLQDSGEYPMDLTAWHTLTVERRVNAITISVDGVVAWTYRGDKTTLPATMKHVVLQQECQAECPTGTTGTEHILVDFVTVEVPR